MHKQEASKEGEETTGPSIQRPGKRVAKGNGPEKKKRKKREMSTRTPWRNWRRIQLGLSSRA